jgi:negative regulator of flagellin synthesis FlgM
MARVEELKTAIRNGELKMDTGKIADALIQDTQDYLQSK